MRLDSVFDSCFFNSGSMGGGEVGLITDGCFLQEAMILFFRIVLANSSSHPFWTKLWGKGFVFVVFLAWI